MAGNALEVRLRTSGPAPEPLTFTIDQPARLSVDLPDVGLALEQRRIDVNAGGVDSIVAAEAGGRTRVVFNLDSLVPYAARAEGNAVIVTLGAQAGAQAAVAEYSAAAAAGPPQHRRDRLPPLRRGCGTRGGQALRPAHAGEPQAGRQPRHRRLHRRAAARGADEALRRVDFATPVSTVDATRLGDSARIVVTASGDFEQLAYQTDDTYVVEVKQRPKKAIVTEAEKVYTGERLTLNFQDIDVRAVAAAADPAARTSWSATRSRAA